MRKYKDRIYTGLSAQVLASAGQQFYPWIVLDHHVESFMVAYSIRHAGVGQVSATIEGTFDDPNIATSCKVFTVVTANASTGILDDGVITQPCHAIRYRPSLVSAAVTITLQLLQAGN